MQRGDEFSTICHQSKISSGGGFLPGGWEEYRWVPFVTRPQLIRRKPEARISHPSARHRRRVQAFRLFAPQQRLTTEGNPTTKVMVNPFFAGSAIQKSGKGQACAHLLAHPLQPCSGYDGWSKLTTSTATPSWAQEPWSLRGLLRRARSSRDKTREPQCRGPSCLCHRGGTSDSAGFPQPLTCSVCNYTQQSKRARVPPDWTTAAKQQRWHLCPGCGSVASALLVCSRLLLLSQTESNTPTSSVLRKM